MIKTYHLYSLILYQSMPGPELSALVDTNREYQNAVFDIRTNARWMASLAQNPLFLQYLLSCPAIVGLVVDNKTIVDTVLLHEDNYAAYLPMAAGSPAAVLAIADSYLYTRIRSAPKWSDMYDPGSPATVIKALSLILNMPDLPTTHTTFEDVAADAGLMGLIAANRQCLAAIGGSEEGMAVISADAAAMEVLANSQAAMDVIAVISTARAAVSNSEVAMTAIAANAYAIRTLVTVPPRVDVFDIPENIAIIAASDVALQALWTDVTTASAILGNKVLTSQLITAGNAAAYFAQSSAVLNAVTTNTSLMANAISELAVRTALFEFAPAVSILKNRVTSVHLAANSAGVLSRKTHGSIGVIYSGKAILTQAQRPPGGSIKSTTLTIRDAANVQLYKIDVPTSSNVMYPIPVSGEGLKGGTNNNDTHFMFYYVKMDSNETTIE